MHHWKIQKVQYNDVYYRSLFYKHRWQRKTKSPACFLLHVYTSIHKHVTVFCSAAVKHEPCVQSIHKTSHEHRCHVTKTMKNSVFPNRGSSYPATSTKMWASCCLTNVKLDELRNWRAHRLLPCGPPANGWLQSERERRCCWHQWTVVTSVWTWARTCQWIKTCLLFICASISWASTCLNIIQTTVIQGTEYRI